jgi:hypothetical protein
MAGGHPSKLSPHLPCNYDRSAMEHVPRSARGAIATARTSRQQRRFTQARLHRSLGRDDFGHTSERLVNL